MVWLGVEWKRRPVQAIAEWVRGKIGRLRSLLGAGLGGLLVLVLFLVLVLRRLGLCWGQKTGNILVESGSQAAVGVVVIHERRAGVSNKGRRECLAVD